MKGIDLRFHPRMESAILDGKKCATTRSERKGNPGDVFVVGGQLYRIIDVKPFILEQIVEQFYRIEGFESTEDFLRFLNQIWRGHVAPSKIYYIHFFAHVVDRWIGD